MATKAELETELKELRKDYESLKKLLMAAEDKKSEANVDAYQKGYDDGFQAGTEIVHVERAQAGLARFFRK